MIFRSRNLIQLSLLYLPLNLFWTAMVSQMLPTRVALLNSGQKGFDLGMVNSCGALAATLCMFLVGPLSDNTTHRYGRRFPWVVGGVLTGTIGALLFSLAPSLPVLLLAFVMARLGFAAAIAAYEAILPDRVPLEYQSRASGWNEMFDVLGLFSGLAFTALLVRGATNKLFGLHLAQAMEQEVAIMLICAGSAFLLVGILALNAAYIREPPKERKPNQGWKDAVRLAFSFRPSQAPDFFKLYLSRCVLNLGIFTGSDFLLYYVSGELHVSKEKVALEVLCVSLFYTIGGVFGALMGGRLGDKFSKRTLLYFFCVLAALAAVGFCLTDSVSVARGVAFFYGIGSSAINTVDWAFATNLVPKGHEARYLAIFQTCFYLPQIVVGMGGFIGDAYGYRTLFWTIPFWLMAGMLLLTQVRERSEISELSLG